MVAPPGPTVGPEPGPAGADEGAVVVTLAGVVTVVVTVEVGAFLFPEPQAAVNGLNASAVAARAATEMRRRTWFAVMSVTLCVVGRSF
ncbi:hypothetical protein MPRM_02910 [Mycobacterium parmense]|uniref:Uncharacterized protein n=1 Tax=Mycobacterium parmense TaxID=185642 RepID=A0A7I7YMG1_9MYCO|nr:hypothetical protein AWC20_12090 [Mycobacterium parmense]BBZ43010.1 hypothetical protein MPRM_02910 [Mycobacterium parmense]